MPVVACLVLSACGSAGADGARFPGTGVPASDERLPSPSAVAKPTPHDSATSAVTLIDEQLKNGCTPLLRTDFTDDHAWATLVSRVTAPRLPGQPGGPDLEGNEGYDPNDLDLWRPDICEVADTVFDQATVDRLVGLWPPGTFGTVVLADARSMTEAAREDDASVLWLDLAAHTSFRAAVEFSSLIQQNFSLGNMDAADFVGVEGPDGVFRGFPAG